MGLFPYKYSIGGSWSTFLDSSKQKHFNQFNVTSLENTTSYIHVDLEYITYVYIAEGCIY